jgi:hypothetical protein
MSVSSSLPASERDAVGRESAGVFTPEELAHYDGGTPGWPIMIGYEGNVYDVTGLFM